MIKNLFSILINQYLTFYELFILSNQNKTKIYCSVIIQPLIIINLSITIFNLYANYIECYPIIRSIWMILFRSVK